ncbi:MAG: spore germination protein [Eubacteriales bacterium]
MKEKKEKKDKKEKNREEKKQNEKPTTTESFIDQWVENLQVNSDNLKIVLGSSSDFVLKSITVNDHTNVSVDMAYIDGLINHEYISDLILKPLVNDVRLIHVHSQEDLANYIQEGIIYFSAQKTYLNMKDIVGAILNGNVILMFNTMNLAIGFDTKGYQMRSISTPTEETSIKGSKDAFVETIRVNTATLRRKIRSNSLVIDEITLGEITNTQVAIVYMENLVNKSMLKELKARLHAIKSDNVLYTGVIEENICDSKYTAFPQVNYTEKPDKFSSGLLEGKIGIMVDGIPNGMIVPTTINDFFQTTDDYSNNYIITSFYRLMRYVLTGIALLLCGYFICITTFHQQLLPAQLSVSIITSREGVPFPIFFEVIILVLAFQALIEAGTRISSSIGSMVTLVGALVVGEAAVNAKFVSPAAVVVVAIASIANYTIPNKDFANSMWLWQFVMIVFSSVIGIFGLAVGGILLIFNLASMEILGVPYLSPFVKNEGNSYKDTLIRNRFGGTSDNNPNYIQRTEKR